MLTDKHRNKLNAKHDDWTRLEGLLAAHHTDDGACPDSISKEVAEKYVLTRDGSVYRLLATGGLHELEVYGSGRVSIYIRDERWRPQVSTLLERAWPEPKGPKTRRDTDATVLSLESMGGGPESTPSKAMEGGLADIPESLEEVGLEDYSDPVGVDD